MAPPPSVSSTSCTTSSCKPPNLITIKWCYLTASPSPAPIPSACNRRTASWSDSTITKNTCHTSMHGNRVDMPWDGALPMLRHGPLQLKVIAFPVPLLFFPLSSSLLLSPALCSSQSAGSPSFCRCPRSYSLLSFYRPPSLCLALTRAYSSLCWNLLREMAVVQQRHSWQHCACVTPSTCVCVRERESWRLGGRACACLCVCENESCATQRYESVHAGAGMLSTQQRTKHKFLPMIHSHSLAHSLTCSLHALFPPLYTLYSLSLSLLKTQAAFVHAWGISHDMLIKASLGTWSCVGLSSWASRGGGWRNAWSIYCTRNERGGGRCGRVVPVKWEREEGRDKREREHLKYPLVTTAANDEAVLSPRRGCSILAWQPVQVRRMRRMSQEGSLSMTVACGSALLDVCSQV